MFKAELATESDVGFGLGSGFGGSQRNVDIRTTAHTLGVLRRDPAQSGDEGRLAHLETKLVRWMVGLMMTSMVRASSLAYAAVRLFGS